MAYNPLTQHSEKQLAVGAHAVAPVTNRHYQPLAAASQQLDVPSAAAPVTSVTAPLPKGCCLASEIDNELCMVPKGLASEAAIDPGGGPLLTNAPPLLLLSTINSDSRLREDLLLSDKSVMLDAAGLVTSVSQVTSAAQDGMQNVLPVVASAKIVNSHTFPALNKTNLNIVASPPLLLANGMLVGGSRAVSFPPQGIGGALQGPCHTLAPAGAGDVTISPTVCIQPPGIASAPTSAAQGVPLVLPSCIAQEGVSPQTAPLPSILHFLPAATTPLLAHAYFASSPYAPVGVSQAASSVAKDQSTTWSPQPHFLAHAPTASTTTQATALIEGVPFQLPSVATQPALSITPQAAQAKDATGNLPKATPPYAPPTLMATQLAPGPFAPAPSTLPFTNAVQYTTPPAHSLPTPSALLLKAARIPAGPSFGIHVLAAPASTTAVMDTYATLPPPLTQPPPSGQPIEDVKSAAADPWDDDDGPAPSHTSVAVIISSGRAAAAGPPALAPANTSASDHAYAAGMGVFCTGQATADGAGLGQGALDEATVQGYSHLGLSQEELAAQLQAIQRYSAGAAGGASTGSTGTGHALRGPAAAAAAATAGGAAGGMEATPRAAEQVPLPRFSPTSKGPTNGTTTPAPGTTASGKDPWDDCPSERSSVSGDVHSPKQGWIDFEDDLSAAMAASLADACTGGDAWYDTEDSSSVYGSEGGAHQTAGGVASAGGSAGAGPGSTRAAANARLSSLQSAAEQLRGRSRSLAGLRQQHLTMLASLFPDHPESELLALLDAYADDLGAVVGWLMEEGDKLADDARAAQEVADQELARHMHVEEEETLRSRRVPNAVTSLEADYLQNADGMLAAASGNGLSSTINTAPLPLSALSHSAAALDRMSAHAGGAAGTAGGSDSWQLAVQRAAGAGSAGVAAAGGQPSQEAILRRRVDMLAKLFPAADREMLSDVLTSCSLGLDAARESLRSLGYAEAAPKQQAATSRPPAPTRAAATAALSPAAMPSASLSGRVSASGEVAPGALPLQRQPMAGTSPGAMAQRGAGGSSRLAAAAAGGVSRHGSRHTSQDGSDAGSDAGADSPTGARTLAATTSLLAAARLGAGGLSSAAAAPSTVTAAAAADGDATAALATLREIQIHSLPVHLSMILPPEGEMLRMTAPLRAALAQYEWVGQLLAQRELALARYSDGLCEQAEAGSGGAVVGGGGMLEMQLFKGLLEVGQAALREKEGSAADRPMYHRSVLQAYFELAAENSLRFGLINFFLGDIVNLLSDYEQDRRPLAVRSHEYKQTIYDTHRALWLALKGICDSIQDQLNQLGDEKSHHDPTFKQLRHLRKALMALQPLAQEVACKRIFRDNQRMMETAQVNTDLHGLHVNEVAKALREEYTLMAGRPGRKMWQLVVGQGKHSQGGELKLKVEVLSWLSRMQLPYDVSTPGVVWVSLQV